MLGRLSGSLTVPMPTGNRSASRLFLLADSATPSTPPLCQAGHLPSASPSRPGETAHSRQIEIWKMRLPAKASTVTYPVDGTTALAVPCGVGDARAGAVPARDVEAVVEAVQEMAESVQAEMDALRRPKRSWMLRWRITSVVEVGRPSQRAMATAKLLRPRPQKTIST